MVLDDQGRAAVFAHLQEQGYQGTLQDWWGQVCLQSCASQVRRFKQYGCSTDPRVRNFVKRLLDMAEPRFDHVYVGNGYNNPTIALSKRDARRTARRVGPLRLDGLDVEIEEREDHYTVYVKAIVNTELRRQRAFHFDKETRDAD
jgi:hypothetical protein